jgi:hypothetical protein
MTVVKVTRSKRQWRPKFACALLFFSWSSAQ